MKLYRLFGGALFLTMLGIQFTGWGISDVETVPKVPKTVRENPGVYRSHYHGFVYTGGK